MKGAQIEPGREFLTELSGAIEAAEQRLSGEAQNAQTQTVTVEVNEEQAVQEIEDMVQSASEMGLDTLFVNLENAYGTLWNSSCPMVSFDVLGSLSDAVPVSYTHLDVYKRQDDDYVTINRIDNQIMSNGRERIINVNTNGTSIKASSSNTNVAKVSTRSDDTLIVEAVNPGSAYITVTSSRRGYKDCLLYTSRS